MADLDGTLLNSKGQLSEYTKTTINALVERGLPFTINTSRSLKSAMSVIDGLKLKLPIVLMNGSFFWNVEKEETEHTECIDQASARTSLAACLRLGLEPLLFGFSDGEVDLQYKSSETPATASFLNTRKHYYRSCTKVPAFNVPKNTTYIICVGEHHKLLTAKKT